MSMQLRIVHTTQFEYDGKAVASRNQARLTPQTMPGQIVVHRRILVSPSPWTYEYRDYFGSAATVSSNSTARARAGSANTNARRVVER